MDNATILTVLSLGAASGLYIGHLTAQLKKHKALTRNAIALCATSVPQAVAEIQRAGGQVPRSLAAAHSFVQRVEAEMEGEE